MTILRRIALWLEFKTRPKKKVTKKDIQNMGSQPIETREKLKKQNDEKRFYLELVGKAEIIRVRSSVQRHIDEERIQAQQNPEEFYRQFREES